LSALDESNFFQSFEWGLQKERLGWKALRLIARQPSGQPVAMLQALIRSYYSVVSAVWIPGGPAGRVSDWADTVPAAIRKLTPTPLVYVRMNDVRRHDPVDVAALAGAGWQRVERRLGSQYSMALRLQQDPDQSLRSLSSNWRHNLKRSRKHELKIERWHAPDPAHVARLYAEMEEYKSLDPRETRPDLEGLCSAWGNGFILYRCTTRDGVALGLRACGILGTRAWDLLAATNAAGRKVYASYGLLWELLEHCRGAGVTEYDFSGVDPDGNRGVYDFKRGTGAELFEYLGEWDLSYPRSLRRIASARLRRL
jgi:lipid II:glycine glycyltransferase (peptidoglycan interpeptide bridge formation enzyme)